MRFVAAALVAAAALHAQHNIPDAGRQRDLDFVSSGLPRLHVNFFATLDRGVYRQAVADLQARLSTATDAEFYVGLAQVVALADDMDTYILPPPLRDYETFEYGILPLHLVWLEDGLFVDRASSDYSRVLGTQVVAVNGIAIGRVIRTLGTTFAYANQQYLHSRICDMLPSLFLLQGLGIVPAGSTIATLTFQPLGAEQFDLVVEPGAARWMNAVRGPTPDYLLDQGNYWFSYNAASKLIYARYARSENETNHTPLDWTSAEIIETLDRNPVDTLVIDLRGNGEGNEYLLFPLGAALFQRLAALRTDPNFRIYIVIDKGTFSAGKGDAMAFKSGFLAATEGIAAPDLTGVLYVIGEPTGGKPIECTAPFRMNLPYAQSYVQYSTALVDQTEGVIPDLPSFNPDIYVPTWSTDYFAAHDPVMAAILARYQGSPAAASGSVTTVNGASLHTEQGLAAGSFAAGIGNFASVPDQVLMNGMTAKVVSAGTTQVNFLVPESAAVGTTTISVRTAGRELARGTATVTSAGPGLFVADPSDLLQSGAIGNPDGSLNSPANPAVRGSVVALYGTGYGTLDSSGQAAVQVFFGDVASQVLYSGPVLGVPGLWQINARVPSIASGANSVFVTAGGLASNAVTIWAAP